MEFNDIEFAERLKIIKMGGSSDSALDILRTLGFTSLSVADKVILAYGIDKNIPLAMLYKLESNETLKKKKFMLCEEAFKASGAKLLIITDGETFHFYSNTSLEFSRPIRVVSLKSTPLDSLVEKLKSFYIVNLLGDGLERLVCKEAIDTVCRNIAYEVKRTGRFPSEIGRMIYNKYIASDITPKREDVDILCTELVRHILNDR